MDERLRKFAYLVDVGSFTKAAHELHISQPALSAAISKLERELHTSLLTRNGKNLELTEPGRFAYATAKELGIQTTNLVKKLAELEYDEPAISIGMIDSVANALCASEANFSEFDTFTKLSIVVNNSRFLIRAAERGELDMAFATHQLSGRLPSSLETTRLSVEPMPLVCHSSDLLTTTAAVQRGYVPNFISYDQASTTYHLVNNTFKEFGLQPQQIFSSSSPEVILRLVLLRRGSAILPYISVKELVAHGRLAVVGNPDPILVERHISLVKQSSKDLTAPMQRIISHTTKLLDSYHVEASAARSTR